MLPQAAGVPADAALELSGASRVAVRACAFKALGGGGVHAANGTNRFVVAGSTFERLGQSAVMLTGNATTQPRFGRVEGNAISRLGLSLSSAAGVYCSSCSDTQIVNNSVAFAPRWGGTCAPSRTAGRATARAT